MDAIWRKKIGAIRDPNQMAGINKDFQSECNMRIYYAYSVRWFTIFNTWNMVGGV